MMHPLGIMSAMPQEADLILGHMQEKHSIWKGTREFVQGLFEDVPVVFTLAGVGKAAAAAATALMISQFEPHEIIFTGVAGGGGNTTIGDIVVGSSYLQHDLDLRPVLLQFFIFSLNTQLIEAPSGLVSRVTSAAERFLQRTTPFPSLGIFNPQVHNGVIVSGDQFIGDAKAHQGIVDKTGEILPNGFHAIEMEGAPFVQVCKELKTDCVAVRSISDRANDEAAPNFQAFMAEVAGTYSVGVLQEYCHSSVALPTEVKTIRESVQGETEMEDC